VSVTQSKSNLIQLTTSHNADMKSKCVTETLRDPNAQHVQLQKSSINAIDLFAAKPIQKKQKKRKFVFFWIISIYLFTIISLTMEWKKTL
jgi:hypothetical protein